MKAGILATSLVLVAFVSGGLHARTQCSHLVAPSLTQQRLHPVEQTEDLLGSIQIPGVHCLARRAVGLRLAHLAAAHCRGEALDHRSVVHLERQAAVAPTTSARTFASCVNAALALEQTNGPGELVAYHMHSLRRCGELFTVKMGKRAALAIYAGTRHVRLRQLKLLGYIERCQRNPRAQSYVRWFDHHQAALNAMRRYDASITPYGGWAIPRSIVMCESHGVNDSTHPSGPSGYYQIQPPTWQAAQYGGGYGVAYAYEASKAEQDMEAHRIWTQTGPSQWSCSSMVAW